MALAVERQSELEQSRAQLDLDWQRRYEDLERLQYAQSEDLVKTLTSARNDVSDISSDLECQGKSWKISEFDSRLGKTLIAC